MVTRENKLPQAPDERGMRHLPDILRITRLFMAQILPSSGNLYIPSSRGLTCDHAFPSLAAQYGIGPLRTAVYGVHPRGPGGI